MNGWKITLLALMGGLGAAFTAGGARALIDRVQGSELAVGIGVMLLVATALLSRRWMQQ